MISNGHRWITDHVGREHDLGATDEQLDFDSVEALGLDGTGITADERFPYTVGALTDVEAAKLLAWRTRQLRVEIQADGLVYVVDRFQRVRDREPMIDRENDEELAEVVLFLLDRVES